MPEEHTGFNKLYSGTGVAAGFGLGGNQRYADSFGGHLARDNGPAESVFPQKNMNERPTNNPDMALAQQQVLSEETNSISEEHLDQHSLMLKK